jgi:hypothetical protein
MNYTDRCTVHNIMKEWQIKLFTCWLQYTAFTNIYLYCRGNEYWRFDDVRYEIAEAVPPYPRSTATWWFGCWPPHSSLLLPGPAVSPVHRHLVARLLTASQLATVARSHRIPGPPSPAGPAADRLTARYCCPVPPYPRSTVTCWPGCW